MANRNRTKKKPQKKTNDSWQKHYPENLRLSNGNSTKEVGELMT